MAIVPRPDVPAPSRPAAPARVRRPPTQGQLSLACYQLVDLLGGREVSQDDRDAAAADVYEFAAKSVATAWSVVDAATMAVRCFSGRRKVSGARGDVIEPFAAALEKAKRADLARADAIRKEIATAQGEAKAALETELRERLLRGIQEGRELELGRAAGTFLTAAMLREFQPVKGSPLAEQDFPRFVRRNVRFLDWLGLTLLFRKEQAEAYQSAKAADKAARADAAASPAPAEEKVEAPAPAAEVEVEPAPAAKKPRGRKTAAA